MGKGSTRRKEDTDKIRDNWDSIFGKKNKEVPAEQSQKPEEKPDAK